jgi:hypothetical protein
MKPATLIFVTGSLILTQSNKKRKEKNNGRRTTAVWRNWGFRLNLKLVLYLDAQSLFDTFGVPNPN